MMFMLSGPRSIHALAAIPHWSPRAGAAGKGAGLFVGGGRAPHFIGGSVKLIIFVEVESFL